MIDGQATKQPKHLAALASTGQPLSPMAFEPATLQSSYVGPGSFSQTKPVVRYVIPKSAVVRVQIPASPQSHLPYKPMLHQTTGRPRALFVCMSHTDTLKYSENLHSSEALETAPGNHAQTSGSIDPSDSHLDWLREQAVRDPPAIKNGALTFPRSSR